MVIRSALLFLLSLLLAPQADGYCYDDDIEFEGHCYFGLQMDIATYDVASTFCEYYGMETVKVTSAAQQEFLTEHFPYPFWIAIKFSNSYYRYTDNGAIAEPTFWDDGEPYGQLECALANYLSPGKWATYECEYNEQDFGFVCQAPAMLDSTTTEEVTTSPTATQPSTVTESGPSDGTTIKGTESGPSEDTTIKGTESGPSEDTTIPATEPATTTASEVDCSAVDSAFTNIDGNNTSPIYKSLYALGDLKNFTLKKAIRALAVDLTLVINNSPSDPDYKTILQKFDDAFDDNADKAPDVEEMVRTLSVDFTDADTETNHTMTVDQMFSCIRDAAFCDDLGGAVTTPSPTLLYKAISNACSGKCNRDDDKAVVAFAEKLENAINAIGGSELKIKKAQELIASFLKQNSGTDMETVLLETIIDGNLTVGAFVKCGEVGQGGDKKGDCGTAGSLIVDTDGEDSSVLHLAINGACKTLDCDEKLKKATNDGSYEVSDVIKQSDLSTNEKLVLVNMLLNELLLDLFNISAQFMQSFSSMKIDSWGTISEFIACTNDAECDEIIKQAFDPYDESGYCLMLDMMGECSECEVDQLMAVMDWIETLLGKKNFATMTPAQKAELIDSELDVLGRDSGDVIRHSLLMEFGGRNVTVDEALDCFAES